MVRHREHLLVQGAGIYGQPADDREGRAQTDQGDRRRRLADGLYLLAPLVSAAETDTRMRIVLDVELPMMMKMMVGKKLAGAVDQIAEKIAEGFNSFPAGTTIPK